VRDPRHDPRVGDAVQDSQSLVTVEAVGAAWVEGVRTRGSHRALRGWTIGSWRMLMSKAQVVTVSNAVEGA